MSQPAAYNRTASFTNLQAVNPTGQPPGTSLDIEFNNVKTTLDAILANLALIQRDDTALANESVGLDQLSDEVTIGFSTPTAWATTTSYVSSPASTVFNGGKFYSCLVSHTSGVFATDLAALKWVLIADLTAIPITTAAQVSVTASGILTTDVQGSLQALDTGKAATSHTHPSSAITDSTAAGRNFLTAADLPAQKTILGLGALAFLNTVPVTDITAQIALSGIIEPAALNADTNDWAPTGVGTASTIRMSSSLAISLTGLVAAAADGTVRILENVGATYAITLLPSSTSSAAANRFLIPKPIILRPNAAITLKYDLDGSIPRWRVIEPPSSFPVAGGYKNLICGNVSGPNFTFGGTASTDFKITADAVTLENTDGEAWRVLSVSVTAATGTTGANGFDGTGSLVSAPLFGWVIGNPVTNTVAALLSRSSTAPTMPSGYPFKARVAGTFTTAASVLHRTLQQGRRAQYVVSAAVTTAYPSAGTSTGTGLSAISISSVVPTTASVFYFLAGNSSNAVGSVSPNSLTSATSFVTNPSPFITDTARPVGLSGSIMLESSNVYVAVSTGTMNLFAIGWEDNI